VSRQPRAIPVIDRAVSALVWAATGLVALFWFVCMVALFVLTAPFDRGRYAVGRWFRLAAVTVSKINPFWSFRVSGRTIDDPRRPYVVVANHESLADIFLGSHLPWEMKWLSKDANFRIPVMGWMMRMAGDIRVRRDDRRSRRNALEECRDRLRKRVSVMILPEGTRSGTGELLPFKEGAFRLAIQEQVPVLPLVFVGTSTAAPKGSMVFGRAKAEVRVLDPVETEGLTESDASALRDRVRDTIARVREEMQRERAEGVASR